MSHFGNPFPGGSRETLATGRDVNGSQEGAAMQPTPPAPRVHCCECNQREIDAASQRQARANRDDQYREIISSATVLAQITAPSSSAANDFLEALYCAELRNLNR